MRTALRASFLIALIARVLGVGTEALINTGSIFELWTSARALGMGGAFLALADDEAAVFYNPAGLALLKNPRFSSLFTCPFGAYSYGVISAADRGWGMQFLILDSGKLEKRDLYGSVTGSFRYIETGLVIGIGVALGERLALGLQVKIHGLLFPTTGRGLSLSPCALLKQGPVTYGLVWRNLIAWGLQYTDRHTEPWMQDVGFGICWKGCETTIVLDFSEQLITRGDVRCVRAGMEYTSFRPLILRAGMSREGSTLGFSVEWLTMKIDFAYLLHRHLPDTYVIAFGYSWAGSLLNTLAKGIRSLADSMFPVPSRRD